MAVSKVILNGSTLIDTTDKTVTAGSMLSGITALKNDGTTATGSIVSKSSSDLIASTLTVTAPAGYYASNATKTLTDSNLTAGNIKKDVSIFGVTGTYEGSGGGGGGGDYPWFGPGTVKDYTWTTTINLKDDTSWDSWTASNTAGTILAASTTADFSYTYNYTEYVVAIVTTATTLYTLKPTATKVAIPIATGRYDIAWEYSYPSTYDNCINHITSGCSYFSNAVRTITYCYQSNGTKYLLSGVYGAYPGAATITPSTTGNNVTLAYKRGTISAKCTNNYFSTARKDDIDSENTNIEFVVDVYKTPINNNYIWNGIDGLITAMNQAPEV